MANNRLPVAQGLKEPWEMYGEWVPLKSDAQIIVPDKGPLALKVKKKKRYSGPSNTKCDIDFWIDIRSVVKQRDRHVCRICGAKKWTRLMHVHHIDWNRANNKYANLVLLCQPCHAQVHRERYKPEWFPEKPAPWGEHPHLDAEEFIPCPETSFREEV